MRTRTYIQVPALAYPCTVSTDRSVRDLRLFSSSDFIRHFVSFSLFFFYFSFLVWMNALIRDNALLMFGGGEGNRRRIYCIFIYNMLFFALHLEKNCVNWKILGTPWKFRNCLEEILYNGNNRISDERISKRKYFELDENESLGPLEILKEFWGNKWIFK